MATVLAIDDEQDILEVIRVNLELEGHRVLTARSGEQALDVVRQDKPDLVLLDVMMPAMDGWTVLTRMKSETDLEAEELPVIMLTARTADEDRVRGGIEGAIGYITKPFLPSLLCDEVHRALESDEPAERRQVRRDSLTQLARMEKGDAGATPTSRPHLTRLEHSKEPQSELPRVKAMRERLDQLSPKQRELLEAIRESSSVSQAASDLSVSRSNVYASLRRISRKLGTRSVPELLAILREGDLLDRPAP